MKPALRILSMNFLKPAVNDYYDALKETPIGRDYSKFTIDSKGILRLCGSLDIDLMNSRTRKPLALSTIASKRGINIVRNEFGFEDYSREKLSAKRLLRFFRLCELNSVP